MASERFTIKYDDDDEWPDAIEIDGMACLYLTPKSELNKTNAKHIATLLNMIGKK